MNLLSIFTQLFGFQIQNLNNNNNNNKKYTHTPFPAPQNTSLGEVLTHPNGMVVY